jgi:hypothetical protein
MQRSISIHNFAPNWILALLGCLRVNHENYIQALKLSTVKLCSIVFIKGSICYGKKTKFIDLSLFMSWKNCTFGLYPSSGVSKKLRNKIYIPKNHNTHVQNSRKGQLLTTEPSVSGCMWVCVCLGLYAILVFPRF